LKLWCNWLCNFISVNSCKLLYYVNSFCVSFLAARQSTDRVGNNTPVSGHFSTAVDKRRICTGLNSIWSADDCAFYRQAITFFRASGVRARSYASKCSRHPLTIGFGRDFFMSIVRMSENPHTVSLTTWHNQWHFSPTLSSLPKLLVCLCRSNECCRSDSRSMWWFWTVRLWKMGRKESTSLRRENMAATT